MAAIGIAGYAGLLVLALFGFRRLLLVSALGGFLYALYLTNIERSQLEVWCLYCVCSQAVITLILLASAGWAVAGRRRSPAAQHAVAR